MAGANGHWVKGKYVPPGKGGLTPRQIMAFYGEIGKAQNALSAELRRFRPSQAAHRRIRSAMDVLADARHFDTLTNKRGTREEYHQRAQTVLDDIARSGAGSIGFGATYSRL